MTEDEPLIVDGVELTPGDRIMYPNDLLTALGISVPADQIKNGIWEVTVSDTWERTKSKEETE